MTNATALTDLRKLSDAELAALHFRGEYDEALAEAVASELDRRDRQARIAPARDARQRLHAEWYDAAYADFMAAEAACVGYFVRPEYAAEITEPFRLWSAGNDEWAQSRATRELLDWWIDHPRLTFARWQKMRRDAVRIAGEEAASLNETGSWEVPAAWAAETTEASDGHDTERAEVDGPPPAGHGRERAADTVRPGRDGQQRAAAEAGRMRDTRPVQRGGAVTGAESYTPGNYAAAIVTGGKRRILAKSGIPALEQAQGLLEATEEARALEAIGQPLEWVPGKRDGTWQAGNTACVFVIAEAAPEASAELAKPSTAVERQVPPIPGDQLLDKLRQWFGTYARFPSAAALDAVTLWCAHTHARDKDGVLVFRATPRLYLLSSDPGSGKSRVLELLGMSCPATFGLDLEPTAAGLVFTIGREHATVLLDEGDVLFGAGQRKASVRAIVNGGYSRHGTYLNGRGSKASRVPVFGALAMAGLDTLEKATGDTLNALMSRGIKIRMTQAPREDQPAKVTRVTEATGAKLGAWLSAWTAQQRDNLEDAQPVPAEGISGRAEQIWEPLLAIADAAGGEWPERARAACAELALANGTPGGEQDAGDAFTEFLADFDTEMAEL